MHDAEYLLHACGSSTDTSENPQRGLGGIPDLSFRSAHTVTLAIIAGGRRHKSNQRL